MSRYGAIPNVLHAFAQHQHAIEPDAHPKLVAHPAFLGTPHIGGSTQEAQLAMGRAAIDGLENNRVPGDGWPG